MITEIEKVSQQNTLRAELEEFLVTYDKVWNADLLPRAYAPKHAFIGMDQKIVISIEDADFTSVEASKKIKQLFPDADRRPNSSWSPYQHRVITELRWRIGAASIAVWDETTIEEFNKGPGVCKFEEVEQKEFRLSCPVEGGSK